MDRVLKHDPEVDTYDKDLIRARCLNEWGVKLVKPAPEKQRESRDETQSKVVINQGGNGLLCEREGVNFSFLTQFTPRPHSDGDQQKRVLTDEQKKKL